MIALGYYLLKVFICSAVLFTYYHIALRNKIFHQWNRFYLLAVVVLSLVLPCLHITIGTADESNKAFHLLRVVSAADEYVVDASSRNGILSTTQWAGVLYTTICGWLAVLFLFSLAKVYRIIRSGYSRHMHNIRLIDSEAQGTPFTFLHFIIWNKKIDLHSEAGQLVFKHELVHVQEKHTLDKLLLQTVLIFFWCNPVFWLIRKELGMIHEFIADQKAVEQQGTEAFAAMILQAAYPQQYPHLTHSFFQSPIKRRLAMLTKIQNPKISYLSRILALPLLAFIGLAFTLKTHSTDTYVLDNKITVVIDAGHGGSDAGAQAGGIYEKDLALAIALKVKELNASDRINIILTRNGDIATNLKDRVTLASENKADLFISLHVDAADKEDSTGITVLIPKGNTPYMDQSKVLSSIMVQQLSDVYHTNQYLGQRNSGVWVLDQNTCPAVLVELGYITNAKDLAFIRQSANQKVIAEKILSAIAQYAVSENNNFGNISSDTNSQKEHIAIENVQLGTVQQFTSNDTLPTQTYHGKKIKSLVVKKIQQVVVITYGDGTQETLSVQEAKKQKLLLPPPPPPPAPPVSGKPGNGDSVPSNALIVIDGAEKGRMKELGNLDAIIKPNDIESVNVLKGESATKKYGEKGKNGVIEIITKKSNPADDKVIDDRRIKGDGIKVFTQAEKDAQFPGGQDGWRNYLQKNLDASISIKNGAPEGTYTVQVQFVVHPDGYISDIKTLTHHGYGMEEEVVKLIKNGPKWVPAEQNGHEVASIRKQPVTFVVAAQ